MEISNEEVVIDGRRYVPADSVKENQIAEECNGMPYVMCRTYSAGVFAGYLDSRDGKEVTLKNARRIWRWSGAATLSQLAVDGTSDPDNCKFPCAVPKVTLTEAIEIIPTTENHSNFVIRSSL